MRAKKRSIDAEGVLAVLTESGKDWDRKEAPINSKTGRREQMCTAS